jgi:hypothetical protein
LNKSAYKGEIEIQYKELLADVVKALPEGWAQTPAPPFGGVIDSAGFVSTDGTSGQI